MSRAWSNALELKTVHHSQPVCPVFLLHELPGSLTVGQGSNPSSQFLMPHLSPLFPTPTLGSWKRPGLGPPTRKGTFHFLPSWDVNQCGPHYSKAEWKTGRRGELSAGVLGGFGEDGSWELDLTSDAKCAGRSLSVCLRSQAWPRLS